MIDVQKQVWDRMKIAREANTTIIEIEETILKASINNRTTNVMNILGISEDLQYLIQSNMEDWVYQIQKMLADELDTYSRWENQYVDNNIWEIQELYKDIEQKKESNEERVEDEEVILIKPYKVSKSTSSMTKSSFIDNEVVNLMKYMKFICFPIQMRLFKPPLHYQSLWSRGEQDPDFWKEVVTALVDNKHNTKTSQNGYSITMFQGRLPHEPYFIAINNWGQVIIEPNKKMVATYVVGELEVLIWFMGIWMLKMGYCYNQCLMDVTWTRVKGNDDMIGCAVIVSVSASCSRCYILASSLCFYDLFASCTTDYFLMALMYI